MLVLNPRGFTANHYTLLKNTRKTYPNKKQQEVQGHIANLSKLSWQISTLDIAWKVKKSADFQSKWFFWGEGGYWASFVVLAFVWRYLNPFPLWHPLFIGINGLIKLNLHNLCFYTSFSFFCRMIFQRIFEDFHYYLPMHKFNTQIPQFLLNPIPGNVNFDRNCGPSYPLRS